MSRHEWIVIPEIDNELEFRVPYQSYEEPRYSFEYCMAPYLLANIQADKMYQQYLVEKLSGFTQKDVYEWIIDKL